MNMNRRKSITMSVNQFYINEKIILLDLDRTRNFFLQPVILKLVSVSRIIDN